jgi:hypothetical protein
LAPAPVIVAQPAVITPTYGPVIVQPAFRPLISLRIR